MDREFSDTTQQLTIKLLRAFPKAIYYLKLAPKSLSNLFLNLSERAFFLQKVGYKFRVYLVGARYPPTIFIGNWHGTMVVELKSDEFQGRVRLRRNEPMEEDESLNGIALLEKPLDEKLQNWSIRYRSFFQIIEKRSLSWNYFQTPISQ